MCSVTARPAGRARWPIFLGLAALVVVVDQLAKAWLVSFLRPGERTEVVGEYVRLLHSQNTGALFGLFRDSAPLFGIVSIGVVGLIVWFHHSSGRNTLLSIALGLLLAHAPQQIIFMPPRPNGNLSRIRFQASQEVIDIPLP